MSDDSPDDRLSPEPSRLRRTVRPVLTGLVGLFAYFAFPIILVIILAFVAQRIIGH